MIDKRSINRLFATCMANKWASKRHEAIVELLSECRSNSARTLMLDLVDRMTVLDGDALERCSNELLDAIDAKGLNRLNSIISASAVESKPDSSQAVLYQLGVLGTSRGWNKSDFVNLMGRAIAKWNRTQSEFENIIIVDDFCGTGTTAANRVKMLEADAKGIDPSQIHFFFFAAMEEGISRIKAAGASAFCCKNLKKGISDFENDGDIVEALNEMMRFEEILSESWLEKPLPSLGYGKSEALFSLENGACPNNVFPAFWWPRYRSRIRSNSARKTVLARSEP